MRFHSVLLMSLTAIPLFVARPALSASKTSAEKQSNRPSDKLNVCSITINSSDEIETFKASIGEDNANFIELTQLPDEETEGSEETSTDSNAPAKSFLRKACEQKIKCDVLIVSGHFGGRFFGSSGLSLSVEELEEMSCDSSCDGVLQNPTEVYLFGCNTLAGKAKDRRSPEQYRAALRADGFSAEQAEQVVAFRYSPLGDAFNDRMRRIFRGTPRIYGFDSIAPSGKNVRGLLKNYLKSVDAKTYYIPQNLRRLDESVNGELARALKVTALTQTAGAREMTREQIPICYLNSPKVPFFKKLNWISASLTSKKSFSYLPSINDWLTQLTVSDYRWSDKEFEALERVMTNRELRDSLAGVVAHRDSSILGMQLKVLTFMKFFGWIFPKDYMKKVESLLIGDLNVDFDIEGKDQICGYAYSNQVKVDLPADQIPEARWTDKEFVDVLECAASFNESLMERALKELLKAPEGSPLQHSYVTFLKSLKIPDIAGPRYFKTLFPNGDRGLSPIQKSLLCKSYGSKEHPLWEVARLNPALATDNNYIRDSGCYLKFNEQIYKDLMQHSQRETWAPLAVADALLSQKALLNEKIVLSAEIQSGIMDMMAKDPAIADKLTSLWTGVTNISKNTSQRMLAQLEQFAGAKFFEMHRSYENMATGIFPTETYCPHALNRAEKALTLGRWMTGLAILESVGYTCRGSGPREESHGLSDLYVPQARKVLALLIKAMGLAKETEIGQELSDSQSAPMEVMRMIIQFSIPLQNFNEAKAVMLLNEQTMEGRIGTVSSDDEILKLLPLAKLRPQILRQLKSADKREQGWVKRTLEAVDVQEDSIVVDLISKIRTKGLMSSLSSFRALGRQDPDKAAALWIELYAKPYTASKDSWPPRFAGLLDVTTPALTSQLRAGVKNKTISEDTAGFILKTIAEYSPIGDMTLSDAKNFIRAFGQEFPSAKIKTAVTDSLRLAATRVADCADEPRECFAQDTYSAAEEEEEE